jgi:hypothetical protein
VVCRGRRRQLRQEQRGSESLWNDPLPRNEPSVITVGASNTFATNSRVDDGIATYSSRGPTPQFVDRRGRVRQYDGLVKPDIVAAGNKIISAQSPNNALLHQKPTT